LTAKRSLVSKEARSADRTVYQFGPPVRGGFSHFSMSHSVTNGLAWRASGFGLWSQAYFFENEHRGLVSSGCLLIYRAKLKSDAAKKHRKAAILIMIFRSAAPLVAIRVTVCALGVEEYILVQHNRVNADDVLERAN
jgi:hypothetical protein